MERDPLLWTLEDAASWLHGQAIRFAVIGGIAASIRGEPRSTLDVDLVLGCDVARGLQLVSQLATSEFEALFRDVGEVVERAFLLPVRHRMTKIKVDLALGISGFEQQAIERATSTWIGSVSVPIVSAEDLVILKIMAHRPRDLEDIGKILTRQGDAFDWQFTLRTARELGDAIGQDLPGSLNRLRGLNPAP
jgi:predicted nucleotidyltransferase